MTLRFQLLSAINAYYRTITFVGEKPKWQLLIEIGEQCLSDSIMDEDQEGRKKLNEVIIRLRKNIINPKPEDVAFVLRVADDILTRKHEEIPAETIGIAEDVL